MNGEWPNQSGHVYSFLNPCLTERELIQAQALASTKELSNPVRLIFVGRLERAKGVGRILDILAMLQQHGVDVTLDLVGDGPERNTFECRADALNLQHRVKFHGWLPRPSLASLYGQTHMMVFPSSSEGWPKVLSEGMAYGVVPVAGAISSIPQILGKTKAGIALPPHDTRSFAESIIAYTENPDQWKEASRAGAVAARMFTYESHIDSVCMMFKETWGVQLRKGPRIQRVELDQKL
jgi:glycosyltransferase involved in cell wall biosynthesis